MRLPRVNDDEVIERLLELVHAGEYLDNLYGRPGENLEGATILSVETPADGMAVDMRTARRCYYRGSREHLAARAAGLLDPLPLLTPAPLAAVEVAEGVLGTPLPPLLRRLYLEVGNGGFGPGYGILGLVGGFSDNVGHNALEAYRSATQHGRRHPTGLLPICNWGCGIYSLVDCATEVAPMWGCDPNPMGAEVALFRQQLDLRGWLTQWLDGRLHQPCLIQDPDTGEWRGATDEEMATALAEDT